MDYTTCPERGCVLPAEVVDRHVLESTDGPVEHIRSACVLGHRFFMPVGMLPSAAGSRRGRTADRPLWMGDHAPGAGLVTEPDFGD